MKIFLLLSFACLAGCAYHPQPASVFGASGKQYTAPVLCQALVQCKNAGETNCYYEADSQTDATGNTRDTFYCKQVKGGPR